MVVRPTHRQLEYLVAVADSGRFSEAARQCHVSQPTLSGQIQLLEDRLRVKLLERTPGGAYPTPVGETVVALARDVLSRLDDIGKAAACANHNLGGAIRLGVVRTSGPYVLPYVLPRLKSKYPDLRLQVEEDHPLELQQGVVENRYDCAVTPEPEGMPSLVYRELAVETFRLCVPAGHRLAGLKSVTPAMLKGERILSAAHENTPLHRLLAEFCRSSGADLEQKFVGTSLDALRRMVAIGEGLAFFPDNYIASEFPKEDVVLCDVEGVDMARSVGVIWRHDSVRAPQFARFYDEFRAALTERPRERA